MDKSILRSALEGDANLIICGWKEFSTDRENFFGSVIDNVVRRATVPVLITRFAQPIENEYPDLKNFSAQQLRSELLATEANTYAEFVKAGRLNRELSPFLPEVLQIGDGHGD